MCASSSSEIKRTISEGKEEKKEEKTTRSTYQWPVISVGQALLLLMDPYEKKPEQLEELKKLYLSGAVNDEARRRIHEYLQDPILKNYAISAEPAVINEDPSRRFFETNLCYRTLLDDVGRVSEPLLEGLMNFVSEELHEEKSRAESEAIFQGRVSLEKRKSRHNEVLLDVLHRVNKDPIFYKLASSSHQTRLKNTMKLFSSILLIPDHVEDLLPLDIYHLPTGPFSSHIRGRTRVDAGKSTLSSHMGVIRPYQPVPAVAPFSTNTSFSYIKPSDSRTYNIESPWVQEHFSRLVHPFANSISGTMLAVLRILLGCINSYLNDNKALPVFLTNMTEISLFLKYCISLHLYLLGAHTLKEYVDTLELPEVRDEFKESIPDFATINLDTLFRVSNKGPFNQAIEQTREYNRVLLARRHCLAGIRSKEKSASEIIRQTIANSPYHYGKLTPTEIAILPPQMMVLAQDEKTGDSCLIYKNKHKILIRLSLVPTRHGFELPTTGCTFLLEHPQDFDGTIHQIAAANGCVLRHRFDTLYMDVTGENKGLAEKLIPAVFRKEYLFAPCKGFTLLTEVLAKNSIECLTQLLDRMFEERERLTSEQISLAVYDALCYKSLKFHTLLKSPLFSLLNKKEMMEVLRECLVNHIKSNHYSDNFERLLEQGREVLKQDSEAKAILKSFAAKQDSLSPRICYLINAIIETPTTALTSVSLLSSQTSTTAGEQKGVTAAPV